MSGNKQRKARANAEREQWERDQALAAAGRRRRQVLLGLIGALVALMAVVAAVVLVSRDSPDQSAEEAPDGPVELLPAEAAAEAQNSAAARAVEEGRVVADDYTVETGKPVDSGLQPPPDGRPVACGAKVPANAFATRPRYPGGPAEVLQDGVDYVARIKTSCGPITIDLLEKGAPVAVNSFVFLAEEGFYDGLDFFRDFGGIAAAQAGSGNNTVGWDIGYQLPDELAIAEREGYPIGTVTTAGEGPYTAGSEFFIAYGKEFDAGYRTNRMQTTFGRVLDGMDVIDTVTAKGRAGMGGEAYVERLFMESVTIEER